MTEKKDAKTPFFAILLPLMIITFHGGQLMRFQTGDFVIASNPSIPVPGSKPAKFGSDIVLASSFATEHHNIDAVTYAEREPFVIDGPGQYEYQGYTVEGEPLGINMDDPSHRASAYRFEMDNITVVVLGSVATKDMLNPDIGELCSEVDILVLPVSGESVIIASKLAHFFDPKVVIPTGYWSVSDAHIQAFCKESGSAKTETDKYTVKRKDLDSLSKHVVLLSV